MRTILSATASAALCLTPAAPAMAQNYRFTSFDAPRGATASLNLRVPFGARGARARPSYGLTLSYGQTMGTSDTDGRTTTRGVNLADIRFTGAGRLRNARVASLDLANLDQDRRVSNLTGETSTVWVILALAATGVAVCVIADCFDGDDEAAD